MHAAESWLQLLSSCPEEEITTEAALRPAVHPGTLNPTPYTPSTKPLCPDPQPSALNPLPSTLNPKPFTVNPQQEEEEEEEARGGRRTRSWGCWPRWGCRTWRRTSGEMQFTRQKYLYHLYQRVQGLGGLVCTSLAHRVTDWRLHFLGLNMLLHLKPRARLFGFLSWTRVRVQLYGFWSCGYC